MRKLIKIAFYTGLVFVVLLVAGVFILKWMFPPERIRAIVEPELTRIIQRDVKIKNASLTLYPTIGVNIEGLSLSNTSRTFTVDAPSDLWAVLKRSNLKKKFVNVTLNKKKLTDVVEKDVKLKVGDVLSISRKGFRNKEKLFSLGRLFVDVEPWSLLKNKVQVKSILIDKMEILVEVDRRGSFNFDDLVGPPKKVKPKAKKPKKKKGSDKLPISFKLKSFKIKDSKIVYFNRKARQEIILGDINQNLSVKFDPELKDVVSKGILEIKRMTVRGKGIPVRKSGMYFMMRHKLHVNVKDGNLKIDEFTVGFQRTFLTIAGLVKGFDKPVRYLNLGINSNKLRLHDLYREVPPAMFPQARKMKVKGYAKLGLKVKGVLKPKVLPAISGKFLMNNVYIKYADLPKAINNLNANIGFTMNSLDVNKLAFKLGSNPVSLLLKVKNFKKPIVDALVKANVDLGTLRDVVKLPKGISVKGKINANVKAKGQIDPKNPEKINVKGKIEFDDIVAVTKAVKKPVQVNGTFEFSNDEIELDELEAKIGKSSMTVDMTISDYLSLALPKKVRKKTTRVKFTMKSPLLDADEMLGTSKGGSKNTGKKASKSSKPSGSSGGSSTGDEPINIPKLPDVEVDGKIRVAKLVYADLPIRKGSIDLRYKQGILKFLLSARLFTGSIKESLVLNIKNRKQIKVRNSFSALRMEANEFISKFNDVPNNDGGLMSQLKDMDNKIYGRLNMTSTVSTYGITSNQFKKNMSGKIVMKIRRARIKNATMLAQATKPLPKILKKFVPNLSDFRVRRMMLINLAVRKGRVYLKNLKIPLRKANLSTYGSVGLDSSMDMKVDIAFPRWISRRILRQQKRLKGAASGLLGKIGGGKLGGMAKKQLGGMLNKVSVIPTDKKGRIVPIIAAQGPSSALKYVFAGFRGKSSDSGSSGGSGNIAADAKKLLKNKLNEAKRRAQRELKKAKQRAMKEAAKMKRKALKLANDAKKKAQKAVKEGQAKLRLEAAKRKKELQRKTKQLRRQAEKKKRELQKKAKNEAKKAKSKLKNAVRGLF